MYLVFLFFAGLRTHVNLASLFSRPSFSQAHHDFCPPSTLPVNVELGAHTFEAMCGEGCEINAQFIPSRPACPSVSCSNISAILSTIQTLNASCTSSCTSGACAQAYRVLRAVHDTCDEAGLPEDVEVALHAFEDQCSAQECNTVTQTFDPNLCGLTPASASGKACGCAAASLGFTINCSAVGFVVEAFNSLSSCSSCSVGSACYRNYLIVQV